MTSVIHGLWDLHLSNDELGLVEEIDHNVEFLEQFFEESEKSPARLKTFPELPMPTLAAPYELATMFCLRALALTEGAALLIQQQHYAPAFPVLRSLYEVWAAVTYAHVRFDALVLRGNKWAKFDEIAARLILGTTSQPDTPAVIEIGHILSEARSHMIRYLTQDDASEMDAEVVGQVLDQTYATLSDGTHPTQFGLLAHAKFRVDKLGIIWLRKATNDGSDMRFALLSDLHFGLRLIREFLPHLRATAEDIEQAARRGPMQDPQVRASTVQTLEHLLRVEGMAPSSAQRITQLVEYLKKGETPRES